jgi:hypothetical protein
MAIALRGTASNSAANLSSTLTVTFPGGVAEGDVVYGSFGFGTTANVNIPTPSGYTELADLYSDGTSNDANLQVVRKVMGVTPDSSIVFDNGLGAGNNGQAGIVQIFSGADSTPEDVTTTTATGTNTAVDSPSITTVTDGAWVLSGGSTTVADASVTAPTGYSNQVANNGNGSAQDITVMGASKTVSPAGAENPASWTGITAQASGSWCAASVAIQPFVPRSFLPWLQPMAHMLLR